MSYPQYASLKKLFEDMEKEIIANCVQCGDCIDVCPVFSISSLNELEPSEVAEKMFEVLKDGTVFDEAYIKAFSCTGCAKCIEVCPQGLDPMIFHQVVQNRLVALGESLPEGLGIFLPGKEPFLPDILNSIQMKPSDARWLSEAPPDSEKKEVVLFMGCATLATPDKNFALIDILEKMGIDFAALIGGKLCCGVPNMLAGQLKKADSLSRNLIKNINAFSPEKLVVTCPTCYNQFKKVIPQIVSSDFEVQFISTFLNDNLDKLKFTTPLNKKLTLHEPCPLARESKDDLSIRKIIKALPGVELIEMEHNREESLCCGGAAGLTYPEYAGKFSHDLMEEGKAAKVDGMINICPFCHLSLYPLGNQYSFELTDLASLINEAQGGRRYENKLQKYWSYKDLDKILEESKEYIKESNFSQKMMEQILPLLFHLP